MNTKQWLQLSVMVAFAGAVVGSAISGAALASSYLANAPPDGQVTCWTDPEPHWRLDFDFHTFVGGRPVRCGYLEPRPGSVLPRVLGDQERAVYSDIACYSMVPTKCPEGALEQKWTP